MGRGGFALLLLAFLAGGGIGFVAGSGTAETPPDVPASPPPEREPRAEPPPEPPAPSAADHDTIVAWIRAFPAPEPERGDGVLSGTVTRKDGTPIPDVLIRAVPRPRNRGTPARYTGRPPEDPDLVELVRETVTSRLRRVASRRETRTDAEGRFRLTGLADHPHSVHAYREGYRFSLAGANQWRVALGSELAFTGNPSMQVKLRVLLPDGVPAESAQLTVGSGDRTQSGRHWTAASPRIELGPGTWTLTAEAGQHREYRSAATEVVVEEGRKTPPVELRCEEIRGIRGRVRFPEGEKGTSCEVAAMPVAAGSTISPDRLRNARRKTHVWPNRPEYRLADLPAGSWLVGVLVRDRVVVHDTVEVGAGMAVLDLTVPPPDPSEYVEVTVLGPDGRPVANASFGTDYEVDGSHSGGGSRVQEIEPGRWRVWHHRKPENYDEGGTWGITARTKEYGSKTIRYDRKSTRSLTFRFEAPAVLTVTVEGYVGSGFEGRLRLDLRKPKEGGGWSGAGGGGAISAQGVKKFGPVPPGDYSLAVRVVREGRRGVTAETIPLTLKSGGNAETVRIPKLHTLTVITEDLPEDTRLTIRARRGGRFDFDGKRPENGRVVFEDLPAGEYVVQTHEDIQMMFVRVPGRSVVRFEPVTLNALEVSVRDPDGGLAKAGLREGDLVIGVNGEEFEDMIHMQSLLMRSARGGDAKLIVLRGARRLEVTLDLMKTMRGGDRGGDLDPATR